MAGQTYPRKAGVSISEHHRRRLRTPVVEALWLAPGQLRVSLRWYDPRLGGDRHTEPETYEGDLQAAEDWLDRKGVCLGLDGIH
jgi:hypothetical protein